MLIRFGIRRLFSTKVRLHQNDFSASNIPLISPLLNHRMLGKSHFMSNVDEDAILELLQNISEKPVPPSEINYIDFSVLPRKKYLPNLPKDLNQESINQYVEKLTSFRYPTLYTNQISQTLLEIVTTTPKLLSKEQYIKIILFHHYNSNDKVGFQILNYMIENAEIKQDIDFDNVILSESFKPSMYKQKIERLENLQNKSWFANLNTWYYIFNMFKNPEPKVKMIEIMKDYNVPITPILKSISSIVNYLSPEQMLELYKDGNIDMNNIEPPLFNQLIACYLKDDRIDEAWDLVIKSPIFEQLVNTGLFVTFANHFIKNNQIAFCFAFANYLYTNYKVNTGQILPSILLNVYLKDCPYFENWLALVRILLPDRKQKNIFIHSKTISNLNDYCEINHIENSFYKMEKQNYQLKAKINTDLVWTERPIFQLAKNNESFIKTANLIGQKD